MNPKYYLQFDETGTIVTGCDKHVTYVEIPDGVTCIGKKAFAFHYSLESVKIPNTVTKIDSEAFRNCILLNEIKIPDTVTSIEDRAFMFCHSLSSVEIPEGVTCIGEKVWHNCLRMKNIIVSNENRFYKSVDGILYNKEMDTLVKYPSGREDKNISILNCVNYICEYAFTDNEKIERVDVSQEHQYFKSVNGVLYTKNLDSLIIYPKGRNDEQFTIPSNVNKINAEIFSECRNLISIDIPYEVNCIGNAAFKNCSSLKSIVIPNTLTRIGNELFSGCYSLSSFVMPESIKIIGDEAFKGCESLISIKIPSRVLSIGDKVFHGCVKLNTIDVDEDNLYYKSIDGVLYNKNIDTIIRCPEGKSYGDSMLIPDSVLVLGNESFFNCIGIYSIALPHRLTNIGDKAFMKCSWIDRIEIPESVTCVGDEAFSGLSLRELFINSKHPENIKIGNNAFEGLQFSTISDQNCTLYVPAGLGHIYRNDERFSSFYDIEQCHEYLKFNRHWPTVTGCSKDISSVEIPNGITYISSYAFAGCTNLESIKIPNSVSGIGHNAFYGCISLKTIIIPDSVSKIEDSAFENCTSLTSVKISNNTATIGKRTFYGCKSLISIQIPEITTKIEDALFCGCESLRTVEIPKSVKEIGCAAFSGCHSLRSIMIPQNIEKLCEWAFFGLSQLENITVSEENEHFTSIDGILYSKDMHTIIRYSNGCRFDSFSIPSNVICIEKGAFSGCGNLKSIIIPNSVICIGESAFRDCINLTSLYIPKSVSNIEKLSFANAGLMSICVDKDNIYYDSRKNCNAIINTSTNTLIVGCANTVIPNSVTSIGDGAFAGCSKLKGISIPQNIEIIGDHAFLDCNDLVSINMTNPNTEISENAFDGSSLEDTFQLYLLQKEPECEGGSAENEYEEDYCDLATTRYSSSYAQNVMGLDDDTIDDVFDGDPDAYWNID